MYEQAVRHFHDGRFAEARRLAQAAVDAGDNSQAMMMLLGMSCFRMSDFPAAGQILWQVAVAHPSDADAGYYYGLSLDRQGYHAAALQAVRAALAARPDFAVARQKAAELEAKLAAPAAMPATQAAPTFTEHAVATQPTVPPVGGGGHPWFGTARQVRQSTLRYTSILGFRVDPGDGSSPTPVEMRAYNIVGTVADGDTVEVRGRRLHSGLVRAHKVINHRTRSVIKPGFSHWAYKILIATVVLCSVGVVVAVLLSFLEFMNRSGGGGW